MKKVLLIARAKTDEAKEKAESFADRIRQLIDDDITVEDCEISELFFEISKEKLAIYHPQKKFDLRDFDLVVIRHIGNKMAYAVEAHAITLYCDQYGIKYTDSYLNRPLLDNKLSTGFLLWANGLKNQPFTLFGNKQELIHRFAELGGKGVLKDNEGSKGRLNFVVTSEEDIRKILANNQDIKFVLQEFIPNDSDLRVLVLNNQPALIIKRSSSGETHLNNTSQGGRAEILDVHEIRPEILTMAVQAAGVTQLEVAGIDIVINAKTQEPYILEVNNAPQVSSGSFMSEKAVRYAQMIKELVG